jgi:hypothetical protein
MPKFASDRRRYLDTVANLFAFKTTPERRRLHERCPKLGNVARLDGTALSCRFNRCEHHLVRDVRQPFSPLDDNPAQMASAERDAFQASVIVVAGLDPFALEILDCVNPTASWKRVPAPVSEHVPEDDSDVGLSVSRT